MERLVLAIQVFVLLKGLCACAPFQGVPVIVPNSNMAGGAPEVWEVIPLDSTNFDDEEIPVPDGNVYYVKNPTSGYVEYEQIPLETTSVEEYEVPDLPPQPDQYEDYTPQEYYQYEGYIPEEYYQNQDTNLPEDQVDQNDVNWGGYQNEGGGLPQQYQNQIVNVGQYQGQNLNGGVYQNQGDGSQQYPNQVANSGQYQGGNVNDGAYQNAGEVLEDNQVRGFGPGQFQQGQNVNSGAVN